MKTDTCRSCGAEIVWLKNDTTLKPAPIDVAPDPAGNVVMTYPPGRGAAYLGEPTGYHVLTVAERRDREAGGCDPYHSSTRHTSHFSTCPQAKTWKKRPCGKAVPS